MYQLSVLVPGIRNENWLTLYNSVAEAFSGSWEIIFAGPYDLPAELQEKDNVHYIQTWRSPIAAQQQCLIVSRGDLITWAADDGTYLPGSLDDAFNLLKDEPYTTIVTCKYFEGDNPTDMDNDRYYTLSNHESMKLEYLPKDCLMLNCGVISRSLLIELGGWDSVSFQACPMSYSDFAIRAYRYGCKFILQQKVMFKCAHEPGMTGTHGPIHVSQINYDEPMFRGIYSHKSALLRQNIDINNWKKSAEKWSMRFKE